MNRRILHYYLEILFLCLFIVWIGGKVNPKDPFLSYFEFHPFWIVVIMMSVRYGYPIGPISGFVCACLHIYGMTLQGMNINEAVHLGNFHIFIPVLYIVVGNFVGLSIKAHRSKIDYYMKRSFELTDQLEYLRKRIHLIERSYKQLETRIASQKDTFISMYKNIKEFETLSVNNIYSGIIPFLKRHIKAKKVSIYLNKNKKFIKTYPEYDENSKLPKLAEETLKNMVISAAHSFHSKNSLKAPECLIAAPIIVEKGKVDAIITIDELPFSEYNYRIFKLFELLIDWLSRAVSNSKSLEKAKKTAIFDESLKIQSEAYFSSLVQSILYICNASNINSSLIIYKIDESCNRETEKILIVIFSKIARIHCGIVDAVAYFKNRKILASFGVEINNYSYLEEIKKIKKEIDDLNLTDKVKISGVSTIEIEDYEKVFFDSLFEKAIFNIGKS